MPSRTTLKSAGRVVEGRFVIRAQHDLAAESAAAAATWLGWSGAFRFLLSGNSGTCRGNCLRNNFNRVDLRVFDLAREDNPELSVGDFHGHRFDIRAVEIRNLSTVNHELAVMEAGVLGLRLANPSTVVALGQGILHRADIELDELRVGCDDLALERDLRS